MKRAYATLAASALVLLLLAGWLAVIAAQPVHRAGLVISLREEGYRVLRVVRGGPADRSGLVTGDVIASIDTNSAAELLEQSRIDSESYLRRVSRLFSVPGPLQLVLEDGSRVRMPLDDVSLRVRLASVHRTVLSNIIVAILLVGIATVFALGTPDADAMRLYYTLSLVAALTIAVSFFHSLWQFWVLQLVFASVEVLGTATGALLIWFGLQFPRPMRVRRASVAAILATPPVARLLVLGTGLGTLFGPGHLYVHAYLIAAIVAFTVILVMQYRRRSAGARRRIRWVFLGSVVSIGPYVLYLGARLCAGSFIEHQVPGLLNQVAAFSFLLFPMAVGLGVMDVERLDVDRLIATTATYFIVGVVIAAATGLLESITRVTTPVMSSFLLVIVVTIFGRPVHSIVAGAVESRVLRRERARQAAFERFRLDLLVCRQSTDVFTRLVDFVDTQFVPRWLCVLGDDHDGLSPVISRRCDPATDHGPWTTVTAAARHSSSSVSLHPGGGATMWLGGPRNDHDYYLVAGPPEDGDTYVRSDVTLLREAAFAVEQGLLATSFSEQLIEQVEEQRVLVREKHSLLREVHHRVRNNLQVMLSMLRLVARDADEGTRAILAAHERRVYSMSQVHEAAYQQDTPDRVALDRYLGGLVRFVRDHRAPTVRMAESYQALTLPVTDALPCGLIVTEVCGLLCAHGVDVTGTPEVSIAVDSDGATATIRATGNGSVSWSELPADDAAALTMIEALAHQLDGQAALESGVRPSIVVTFPAPEYQEPKYQEPGTVTSIR